MSKLKWWERSLIILAGILVCLGAFTDIAKAESTSLGIAPRSVATTAGDTQAPKASVEDHGTAAALPTTASEGPGSGGKFYVFAAKQANKMATGVAGLGYRSGKLDLSLVYVAESELYGGQTTNPGFGYLSVSRVWTYEPKIFGAHPTWLMGLALKGADRCAYNGEEDCNRRLPLPVSFHFGLELEWTDIRIGIFHDSNNAMDWGPEKKNLGLNYVSLTVKL